MVVITPCGNWACAIVSQFSGNWVPEQRWVYRATSFSDSTSDQRPPRNTARNDAKITAKSPLPAAAFALLIHLPESRSVTLGGCLSFHCVKAIAGRAMRKKAQNPPGTKTVRAGLVKNTCPQQALRIRTLPHASPGRPDFQVNFLATSLSGLSAVAEIFRQAGEGRKCSNLDRSRTRGYLAGVVPPIRVKTE